MDDDVSLTNPSAVLNYFFYDQASLEQIDTDSSLATYLTQTWTTSSTYDPNASSNTMTYSSGGSSFTVKVTETETQSGNAYSSSESDSLDFKGTNGESFKYSLSDSTKDGDNSWSWSDKTTASYTEVATGINASWSDSSSGSGSWNDQTESSSETESYKASFKYSDAAGYKLSMTASGKESGGYSYPDEYDYGLYSGSGEDKVDFAYSDAAGNSFKVASTSTTVEEANITTSVALSISSMSLGTADYSISTKGLALQGTDIETLLGIGGLSVHNVTDFFAGSKTIITNLLLQGNNTIKVLNTSTGQSVSGGAGKDIISGNAAADTINGGDGVDKLSGGKGADTFIFNATPSSSNLDVISDFKVADGDKLQLASSIFASHEFGVNLVYQSSSGKLYYDADGSGAGEAVHFVTLTGKPALSADSFLFA